jgi:nitrogenase molybdenum-iron protein alpha/beta subunit
MSVADRNEVRIPYMVGVYLAVNALPDVYLLTDGPDCLFFKAEYVHGAQDFHSTLLDVKGRHRVAHTLADINNVVLDREVHITEMARRLVRQPEAGMVLITAMPMASITGTQYDRIARELAIETGKNVAEVPAKSLQADWIDGYGQVLAAIAREIPLADDVERDPRTVAVIGPLVDRTEADRLADLKEIKHILEDGLGLKVCSIWPSNVPVAELASVAQAGTIISLPYGTRAAKILKRRTGATLIDAPLPIGPAGVEAFVMAVADRLGCTDRAEAFLQKERAQWAGPLALASENLAGRRFGVIADPWLAEASVSLLRDVGAQVVMAQSTSFDPDPVSGLPALRDMTDFSEVEMFLVPTRGIDISLRLARPFFEYGFTSYGTHAFFDAPLFGFRGAVNLLSGIMSNLALFEWTASHGGMDLQRIADSYQVPCGVGESGARPENPDDRG